MTTSELSRVHEISARCHAEANRLEPYWSVGDTEAFLRHPPSLEPRPCSTARAGGDVVGFAQLALLPDSPLGFASILVDPDARGRGAGRALFDAVLEAARAGGRTTLLGAHATPAGAAFATRLGAVESRRDIRSVLVLAEADLEVDAIDGYRLVSWNGAAPEELVASFAGAREAINDAPAASAEEWHSWDVERVRDLERALERRGRQIRVTVALDTADEVVAFTELRVSPTPGASADTEDTAVVRGHRGRGLAFQVKAESLASLRRERPDVAVVGTTNAEENAAIRAVNERLGFVPAAVHTLCGLDV
jgi:GNAT superfamily N-acetyltransferase